MAYPHDIVFPLSFYSDEFEINDTLSSHNKKHTICGLYYQCLVTPEQFASKLCNIFVAGFIKKNYLKTVGFNAMIEKVIQKFKQVEVEGVLLRVQNQDILVRFPLLLVQGDNLGMHSMLMFSGSFTANYFCRFCKRHKFDTQQDVDEKEEAV